jgi:hypothetical protein
MSARPDELRQHGLAGDHGWNDSDDPPMGGLRSVVLLAVSTAYFGSIWLLSGLLPIPVLVSGRSEKPTCSDIRRDIPA